MTESPEFPQYEAKCVIFTEFCMKMARVNVRNFHTMAFLVICGFFLNGLLTQPDLLPRNRKPSDWKDEVLMKART